MNFLKVLLLHGPCPKVVPRLLFGLRKNPRLGNSLAVQWLRLHVPDAGGMGLIPGRGTKIPHAMWCGQKKKKESLLSSYNLPQL